MDVNADTTVVQKKPRCVITFDTQNEYEVMRSFAKERGLDMKNFFMWLAKSHMSKYRPKTTPDQEDV